MKTLALTLLVAIALFVGMQLGKRNNVIAEVVGSAETHITKTAEVCPTGHTLDVESLILDEMEIVGTKLAPHMKKLTAKHIASVATEILPTNELQAFWVTALSRESKFVNNGTKSGVGAIGVGQLMPQFADYFGKICGYEGLTGQDLRDVDVNARISACYFNHLYNIFSNHEDLNKRKMALPLTLAAYNAGPNSDAVKGLKSLSSMNHETANYLAITYTTMGMPNLICKK